MSMCSAAAAAVAVFYGTAEPGCVPRCNESATPHVHSFIFRNLSLYLPKQQHQHQQHQHQQGQHHQQQQQHWQGQEEEGTEEGRAGEGKGSKPTFQFLGLPESLMSDFLFEDITTTVQQQPTDSLSLPTVEAAAAAAGVERSGGGGNGGGGGGWQCENTSGFSFKNVVPMPTKDSGCLQ
eukprot:COSAG06_NODE_1113_length_10647_cov_5.767823_6_plen_179_part_00